MRNVASVALFAAMCLGAPAKKPVCNAATHGQFWPEEANRSREAARRFYQRGELSFAR